ncbi:hypothetical protein G7068_13645 [Leucobacter viscericola]|uniref:Uncharacterized protein n=1 Tax=Leucobacter viscericola TaxID=2714935 RepID=A0A6G7XHY4_9MICO|nr:hypothetical protein [Leucobacter viscericola]QIK64122.1 hypothetical protein G7068_13645 [Leucobacter viscericola]
MRKVWTIMAGEDLDPLALFLLSCSPAKVSREWHVVKNRDALLMERPRESLTRRGLSVPTNTLPSLEELSAQRWALDAWKTAQKES